MATANFTFTTLTGTETAGWNSINTLITSIDTQLNASNRLIYMSGWSAVAGQTIKWDAANSRWVPGTLDAAALANNSVTEAKIATDAVTSGKIAADAVGSSEIAAGAVTLAKISPTGSSAGQVLTSTGSGSDPSWQNASIGEANIADGAVTENKIATDAVVDLKIKDGAVVTSKIDTGAVTYPKLGDDVKKFSVATSATPGLYFTSSGNLTTASLARNATQQPLVVVNSSSAVDLYLPYNLGSVGDTITITSIGSGFTQILPLMDGPGATGASFFGSVICEFNQVAGTIMLICISDDGSGPFGGTRDWLAVGDYFLD